MRTRQLVAAPVVCFALLVCSARAEAKSFWGWLEELSGPGPFERVAWVAPLNGALCFRDHKIDLFASFNDEGVSKCVYAEWMFFESRNDQLIRVADGPGGTAGATIQAKTFDAGITFGLYPGIEMGVGAGYIHFHTEQTGRSATRFTLVPGRLTFTPARFAARLIPRAHRSKVQALNAFKFVVKSNIIAGTLSGKDFGVPEEVFRETSDFVSSYGVLIDVTEIVKAFK